MSNIIQDRAYQDQAVSASIGTLKEEDRAQLHMCCASGKTYVQAKTLRAYLADSTEDRPVFTVFVPNLGLVRQSEINFRKILGDDVEYLGVGTNKARKKDIKAGAPERMKMTTDLEGISEAINGRQKPLVVFSTYQSSPTLAEALVADDGEVTPVSLSFMDEAHRTAGFKELDSPFSYSLYDHNININKRLFYTATPNTVEFDEANEERIVSMNDPELYGRKIFDYPYSRALKDGVVSPFRIQAPVITKAEVQAYRELKALDDEDDRSIIAELALRKTMKVTGHDKILTFHSTVAKSKSFERRLKNSMREKGFHVVQIDGESSADERQAAFEAMQEGPTIIPSVRAIGEGSDAPGIQSILFADPRQSVIEVIQNIGRLQRVDPNDPDKIGSIICPILIDEASKDSPEEQILNSEYSTIFRVAEGLRASSDVASLTIREASREFGETGTVPKDKKFGIDLIGGSVLSEQKISQLEDAIQIMTFESMADTFEVNTGKMNRFLKEHNRFPAAEDKTVLYNWLASSRERMMHGHLSEEQVAVIERFDRIELVQEKENRRQEEFQEKINTIGNMDLFYDNVDDIKEDSIPGFQSWLDRTRNEHLDNRLSSKEIEALEGLPLWTWHSPEEDMHAVYRHRDRFVERNGREPALGGASNAEDAMAQAIENERSRQLLGDEDERMRQLEDWADREADRRAALQANEKTWPWMRDGADENTLLDTLNSFYTKHSRPPELRADRGPEEVALAQELETVEKAYIETFYEPVAMEDGKAQTRTPFYDLPPSQKKIAESRAFFADRAQGDESNEAIVSGTFRPARSGKSWEFHPRPARDAEDGRIELYKTGHRVLPAPFTMDLSEAQSTRIRALGPDHNVRISMHRAGKANDPMKDGALGRMISAGIRRDESNYFKWIVGRHNDRLAAGKPAYTRANIQNGKIKKDEPITVLSRTAGRRHCTVGKFRKEMENVKEWSFNGRHNDYQYKTLAALPGFAWYEHGDGIEKLQRSAMMISKRFDHETLGNASLRKGNNGLSNTLRAMDKSMRVIAKSEDREKIFAQLDKIKPNTSRSIMIAAKAHQEQVKKQQEEAAKQAARQRAKSADKSQEQGVA